MYFDECSPPTVLDFWILYFFVETVEYIYKMPIFGVSESLFFLLRQSSIYIRCLFVERLSKNIGMPIMFPYMLELLPYGFDHIKNLIGMECFWLIL